MMDLFIMTEKTRLNIIYNIALLTQHETHPFMFLPLSDYNDSLNQREVLMSGPAWSWSEKESETVQIRLL